ncbi:MAG: hypothetical protein Tsb0018_11760 [Opitutales bacterium]
MFAQRNLWAKQFAARLSFAFSAPSLQKAHGDYGERFAARYLKKEKGYKVLARNWSCGRDELDLICKDGEALVCVEVKTRSESAQVPGYYAVNQRKKQAVARAFKAYLRGLSHIPKTYRFDIVEVRLGKDVQVAKILHYPNVFLLPKHFRL